MVLMVTHVVACAFFQLLPLSICFFFF